MAIAADAPGDVGAEVADEEADGAKAAPLAHVFLLVAQEVRVAGRGGPD
jgi:hypothetical protein